MEVWMPWIWGGVILLSLFAEAATAGLVSVWFIPAGAAALTLSVLKVDFWWQITVFCLLSGLFVLFARPILAKFLQKKPFTPTNADRLVGETVTVVEKLDLEGGAVRADGQIWSAKLLAQAQTGENTELPVGSRVTVCAIEGVKLLVVPAKKSQ